MSEMPQKKVDESWKEQVEKEKHEPPPSASQTASASQAAPAAETPAPGAGEAEQGIPEARFDLFISGLAMEALIALGDVPHPATRKQAAHLPHARYLIDLLGILAEKTRGNLSVEEERLFKDALYQLRMRYLAKTGG